MMASFLKGSPARGPARIFRRAQHPAAVILQDKVVERDEKSKDCIHPARAGCARGAAAAGRPRAGAPAKRLRPPLSPAANTLV